MKNKTSMYFKYAIGEIFLVVVGILIALQINNWNETRKENKLESQLIDVLITDLQLKKAEFLNDLGIGNRILKQSNSIIQKWQVTGTIDTLYLKSTLNYLAEDDWFFNGNSPVYATISGSGLWKELPDNLTRQIDEIYRIIFGGIKSAFEKSSTYALQCRLNFLAPKHLLAVDKSSLEIQQIISENNETFISYLELLNSGVVRLTTKFEFAVPAIDQLINDLEQYKTTK